MTTKITNLYSVPIPTSAAEVAALQLVAEADAKEVVSAIIVDCPEAYTAADEILTELAQRKDAAVAMRKSATVPMYQAIRVVEGWFRPLVAALDTAIAHTKGQIGAYRTERMRIESEARAAALTAAEADDGVTLIASLTLAAEAAEKPDGRASVSFRWSVKRILEDLLPDEWWTPDLTKIDVVARSTKGDEPPVIPGVVFERVAKVGARR